MARLRALAEEAGLDPVFAEKFLGFIVEEVIRHHEDIADRHQDDGGGPPSAAGGTGAGPGRPAPAASQR